MSEPVPDPAPGPGSAPKPAVDMLRFLVLQHDSGDPPGLIGDWLAEVGGTLDVRLAYEGAAIPESGEGFDAVISLGGEMNAWDDQIAPWLPATRALLRRCQADGTPTLGICLGAQLLAASAGGRVVKGPNGPEIGAYLTAKRDAADSDPLFGPVPMTPDVMQYHYDVVEALPAGSTLLLSSMGYPHQAWRQGDSAWATQFHFEASAADVRAWSDGDPNREFVDRAARRLGPMLDEAEVEMSFVWRNVIHRFAAFARERRTRGVLAGRRLPMAGS